MGGRVLDSMENQTSPEVASQTCGDRDEDGRVGRGCGDSDKVASRS